MEVGICGYEGGGGFLTPCSGDRFDVGLNGGGFEDFEEELEGSKLARI